VITQEITEVSAGAEALKV
ncbi:MAG TPA: hypothetical protein DCZ52_07370, partial [Lachnospiraceae bacterium]|nr:hypothetical protein [Lachnospiraceae bacterium]